MQDVPLDVTQCVNAAFPVPSLLFLVGILATTFYLKSTTKLGILRVLQALLGREKLAHDRISTLLMLGTLIVPLALWLYLGQRCG